jgi:hypothetical protein
MLLRIYMTGYELVDKLCQHDLNKKVVFAGMDYYQHKGEVILFQDYSKCDDVTGVEVNPQGDLMILD